MINTAIICEYNPFHYGHKEQIERIRELLAPEKVRIISLMSGNYVQRGDLACVQKYKRAEFAVNNGSDLVIELPYPAPCTGAEAYAYYAVRYLDSLGDIDALCFGSESGNINALTLAAGRLLSDEFKVRMNAAATEEFNRSYASVRSDIYREMYGESLPDTPNDILAVEYLKSLKLLDSKIRPVVIRRTSQYSATASRSAAAEGKDTSALVPFDVSAYLSENPCVVFSDLESYFIPFLMTAHPEELVRYRGVNYDLAVKLINASKAATDVKSFEDHASDKRYTRARIRRAVLSCILKDEDGLKPLPSFSVILAANDVGRSYLSPKDLSQINMFTKRSEIKDTEILKAYEKLSAADGVYNYILKKKNIEIVKKPFIIH